MKPNDLQFDLIKKGDLFAHCFSIIPIGMELYFLIMIL